MHGTGAPLGNHTTVTPPEAIASAARVAEVVREARRVLVVGHANADGDVCGSSLGLAQALRELGKEVVVYNEAPYPDAYRWLPGGHDVVTHLSEDERFDCTVVVDAARPDRLGRDFPSKPRLGTYVWVDHHRIDEPPGDVSFIDLTSAAVGEMVAMILDALRHPISLHTAQCLYASLLADTGSFRYGNTSARAFRLAARLVESGVDPWAMTERIYESQDEAKLRLLGRALTSLWVSDCGRLGVVVVTAEDLSASGARDEHIQGLVNHVRGIKGVEVAALVTELPSTEAKVVIRSRGNIAAAPIAAALGKPGNKNAASFVLEGPVEDVRSRLIDVALTQLPPAVVRPLRPVTKGRGEKARRIKKHVARPAE